MYLKALEMRGFKSFPEKTKLEFSKGITAVVGPNGSGKSNISDAVRWVLGEMSPKSLRGQKMEDVIFSGTATRPQTGLCEVSLVLDNSCHTLARDEQEVVITRKYFRDGESEYSINHKPTRLKDIYELFLNTGIGREGYSVIGQGKISEILSQKSEERRHIFEEAAGISKYRYRKLESEKKLAETEANLIRVSDILNEIKSRIGPLEKEAQNAKAYLEYAEQKKSLEVSLWLSLIEKASSYARQYEEKRQSHLALYEAKDAELNEAENNLTAIQNEKQAANLALEQLRRELSAWEEERAKIDSTRALTENDRHHYGERADALSASLEQAENTALPQLADETRRANDALSIKQAEKEQAEKDLEEKKELLSSSEDRCAAMLNALDAARDNAASLRELVTKAQIDEAAAKNARDSDRERRVFLEQEIEKISAEVQKANDAIQQAQRNVSARVEEQETVAKDIQQEKSALAALEEIAEQLVKARNENAAKWEVAKQRKETLERMERLLEGYPGSVKAVLGANLAGICGPVSKLLRVSGEYVTAIETALGAAVSNIVVEDEDSAKKAIRFLQNHNAGRATFLPLSSIRQNRLSESGMEKETGYIGIGSDIVQYDEKYRSVAQYLLGRTIVADNIDHASALAKKYGYRLRIVTLDGQLINAGGSYTGGSAAFQTGVLSRSADLVRIQTAIAELEEKDRTVHAAIRQNKIDHSEGQKYLEGLQNDLSNVTAALYRAKEDARLQNEYLASCKERLDQTNVRLKEFDSERLALYRDEQRQRRISAEHSLFAAEEKLREAQQAAAQQTGQRDALAEQYAQARLTLAALEKDEAIQREKCRQCQQKEKELRASIATMQQELLSIQEKAKGLTFSAAQCLEQLTALDEKIGSAKQRAEDSIESITQLEKNLGRATAAFKELARDKEEFYKELTKAESLLEKSKEEYDRLTARLFEEYALTFSDAVALKLPLPGNTAQADLETIKSKIRSLGHVNVNAVEEYAEIKERFDFLTAQTNDLEQSRTDLQGVIARLEHDMKSLFLETFQQVSANFRQVFADLFGGGRAELILTDVQDVLGCGIDINVQPPGKMVKNLSLLSGGEQTFTAIALYFAILKVRPAPFYIFDEIEAALDDVNVARFAAYLKRHSNSTQFVVITHRRGTMESADTLYGVTMQEKGVSSFLRLSLDEVEKKTGVKL